MKKSTLVTAGVVVGVFVLILAANVIRSRSAVDAVTLPVEGAANAKNATYVIGTDTFTLVNGKAEIAAAPGSATKNTLSIFGEPAYGDLDGDGDVDAAVLLVNNPGGSGSFFYAALALNTETGFKTTNTLLLGDRIAPQNVNVQEGRALFNYAERKVGEPMTTSPSMGKSLWIHLDKASGQIGEWVKDFEGEADTARMTLPMKKWMWVSAKTADGKTITPKKAGVFALTFGKDGRVAVSTDCNSGGGGYTAKGSALTFGPLMSTRMYCDGSQEMEFNVLLADVAGYRFTGKGELILTLKATPGEMTFR